MRRTPRLIAAAVLIAFTGVLGGCSSFDPSDMLDFLDTKKKLPGERKPVFPEGVPGLEQGVPKNLYRGSRQEQIDHAAGGVGAVERGDGEVGVDGELRRRPWSVVGHLEVESESAVLPPARLAGRAGRGTRSGGRRRGPGASCRSSG